MSGFAQPRQEFARKGENCNFEIAVIFYPVKKNFMKFFVHIIWVCKELNLKYESKQNFFNPI